MRNARRCIIAGYKAGAPWPMPTKTHKYQEMLSWWFIVASNFVYLWYMRSMKQWIDDSENAKISRIMELYKDELLLCFPTALIPAVKSMQLSGNKKACMHQISPLKSIQVLLFYGSKQ